MIEGENCWRVAAAVYGRPSTSNVTPRFADGRWLAHSLGSTSNVEDFQIAAQVQNSTEN
jgi:hypothetical protein